MYLEFYYLSFPLVENFKENTIIDFIKQDLNRFFYHFWERIKQDNLFILQIIIKFQNLFFK